MEENKTTVTEDTEEIKANDVFDAETDQITDDASNDIYDAEEAIKQKEKDLGIVRNTDENLSSGDDSSPEEEPLSEDQKNVFDNGLNDGKWLTTHACPMCGVRKKTISELYVRKGRLFHKKKHVVGYMSICANCGFISMYGTNVNEFLKFLRGKVN